MVAHPPKADWAGLVTNAPKLRDPIAPEKDLQCRIHSHNIPYLGGKKPIDLQGKGSGQAKDDYFS